MLSDSLIARNWYIMLLTKCLNVLTSFKSTVSPLKRLMQDLHVIIPAALCLICDVLLFRYERFFYSVQYWEWQLKSWWLCTFRKKLRCAVVEEKHGSKVQITCSAALKRASTDCTSGKVFPCCLSLSWPLLIFSLFRLSLHVGSSSFVLITEKRWKIGLQH